MGATPIASDGAAIGAEGGDGLRGQEVQRAEMSGLALAGGIENLVGLALSDLQTTDHHVHAASLRGKVRIERPFGNKSALAIHLGTSWSSRVSGTLQDEKVNGFDLALPIEVLASQPNAKVQLSGFVAPRLTTERYQDRLNPTLNFNATFPGLTSGLHLRAWFLDAYAETTLTSIPTTTYQGVQYGGRVTLLPMAMLMVRFGKPYQWAPGAKAAN
jgi:hypothetical protein